MLVSRKKFIQITGLTTAAALISKSKLFADNNMLKHYGIQLYTVRDEIPKDPKGVLKQLASFGYTQVESFEGSMGMFWGMSAAEFRKYIEGLVMTAVSSHFNDIYK